MNRISIPNGYLRDVLLTDFDFIKNLYSVSDIRKYCYLPSYDDLTIRNLVQFMHNEQECAAYIIENRNFIPVGYICFIARSVFSSPLGVTENGIWAQFCVHPLFRGLSYARNALRYGLQTLNAQSIHLSALLIERDNVASQHVASSCGFYNTQIDGGTRIDGSCASEEELWLKEL